MHQEQDTWKRWWLLAGLAFSMALLPLVLVYLVIAGYLPKSFKVEGFTAWIVFFLCLADLGLFFLIGIAWGLSTAYEMPAGLERLVSQTGLQFRRRWKREGSFGGVSLFGVGPCFESRFRGLRIVYAPVLREFYGKRLGTRLSVYHGNSMGLGLCCKWNVVPRFISRDVTDQKSVLARRIDAECLEMQCWAIRRKKAGALLRNDLVASNLGALLSVLRTVDGALILRDKRITIILPDQEGVGAEVLEAACDLSASLPAA